MKRTHQSVFKQGFTIVELLIVIIIIAILVAIIVIVFNGLNARADKASMVSDLNTAHKLAENYRAANGTSPTNVGQLNDGNGFTTSNGNTVQVSGSGTSGSDYCITVSRKDQSVMYNSSTDSGGDGACAGHGAVAPAQVAYSSGMTSYSTANTTYPLTPGVALQAGDVVISFHSEHYIVGKAYLKVNGANQNATMTRSLGTGSKTYNVTIVTDVTGSTSLSFTTDGSAVEMGYMVVRGLTNPSAYTSQTAGWSGSNVAGGSSIAVPSQPLKAGQVAIMGVNSTISYVTFPTNPSPAIGSWTIDPVGPGLIRLAYAVGTKDTSTVSAGTSTSGSNYLGAAIFILGD